MDNRTVTNWGAIFAGAAICLGIQLTFVFLGSGLGLFAIDLKNGVSFGQTTLAILIGFGLIGVAGSYFFGGWAMTALARPAERKQGVIHGLAVWAVVATTLILFGVNRVADVSAQAANQAALGAAVGEAGHTTAKLMSQMQIRMITDVSVLKGKAVSDVFLLKPLVDAPKVALRQATKDVKQVSHEVKQNQPEVAQAADDLKHAAATTSLILFAAFFLGAVAAALGGAVGTRPEVPAAKRASIPVVPRAMSPALSQL